MPLLFRDLSLMLLTLLAVCAVTSESRADLILGQTVGIDFNANGDGTMISTTGTGFNSFSADTDDGETATLAAGSLIDLTGASIPLLGFAFENNSGQNTERADFATQGAEGPGSGPLNNLDVFSDAIISNNQGAAPLAANAFFRLTFSGLDDALNYDFAGGFDNNGGNNNFDAVYSSGGQSFTTFSQNSGAPGSGFGTLTGLSTDGSGNLEVLVTANTLQLTVAGVTLTAVPGPDPEPPVVPEPSSALALVGLLGAAFLKRRRS